MKTCWLRGSKRLLSVLLLAATLMLCWTPLGLETAQAATDKGQQFAQAALLFQKDEEAFGREIYGANYTVFSNTGAWCAAFVSVIAKQCGIPTSVIPNWANVSAFCPEAGEKNADRFHPIINPSQYKYSGTGKNSLPNYQQQYDNDAKNGGYVPQVGDIAVWNQYWDSSTSKEIRSIGYHVGIVTNYDASTKKTTVVSGNWGARVQKTVFTSYYGTQWITDGERRVYHGIFGYYHPDWSKVDTMRAPVAVTGISLSSNEFGYLNDSVITIGVGDTLQPEVSVTPSNAFWNPQDGIYSYYNYSFQTVPGYTGLYWKSSNTKVVTVDRFKGTLTSVGEGTATITAYAYADGKRTRATAVQTSFTVNVDNNVAIAREWYSYVTLKEVQLRTTPTANSSNLYGTLFAGTPLEIDLKHITKTTVNGATCWYAPVQINGDEVVYCDISDASTIRPAAAPYGADWNDYKVVWKNGVNMRSFADSSATKNIILNSSQLKPGTIIEMDLNHTAIEPKFGDRWAFARYKQADGTYVYGWCIESDPNYMVWQEKERYYEGYVWPSEEALAVYDAPKDTANIVGQIEPYSYVEFDIANLSVDMQGDMPVIWVYCYGAGYVRTTAYELFILNPSPNYLGNWERAVVTAEDGVTGLEFPNAYSPSTFWCSEGSEMWLDLNSYFVATEADGTQTTYVMYVNASGDEFYSGWFDAAVVDNDICTESDTPELVAEERYGDEAYLIFRGHVSWKRASEYAASLGGKLLVINDADEEAWVSSLLSTFGGTTWLGAHANSDATAFRWSNDDSSTYGIQGITPWTSEEALSFSLFYDWKGFRDCENMYVDTFIVERDNTPRAWFNYRTIKLVELRKEPSLSGDIQMAIGFGAECTVDLAHITMSADKKHFFAPVLENGTTVQDGRVLYCDLADKTAIVPDSEPTNPSWKPYEALTALKIRTFPNTWCDTGVLKTLPTGTIIELDVNHKLEDPRFGNDWAYARYLQDDGTYFYGWAIAEANYVKAIKQPAMWVEYFAGRGELVPIYEQESEDSLLAGWFENGDTFYVDVNNAELDQYGSLWAAVTTSATDDAFGYINLSDTNASGKAKAMPKVYGESGTHIAQVTKAGGLEVYSAPNESSAIVKILGAYDGIFWNWDNERPYTDDLGRTWIPIYAETDYNEMADCGWAILDYNAAEIDAFYTYSGHSISRNGKTYFLFYGYGSWSAFQFQLAIVHNQEEQDIITQLLNATSEVDRAWIGASNMSGAWTWRDGTPVSKNWWGYGEPANLGGDAGLVASFDGSWYTASDEPTMRVQGFITEQFTGIGLPQLKLPAAMLYVAQEAFAGDSSIQAVVAPAGMQIIDSRAFADCANLKCITLPDSVLYIADDAFENSSDVVIFANEGSYAWQWAEEHGMTHGTPYVE